MAINAINGIAVDTDSVINGISGVDEVNGLALDAGGGFVPASGNVFWFKADSLALSDNDPVTTVTDSSGLGNDHTQATGAVKPTFKTAIVNGEPVIRGDGADVAVHTGQVTASVAFSISAVVKYDIAAGMYFYFNGDAGSNGWGIGMDVSGNRAILFGGVGTISGDAMTTSFEVWSVVRDGSTMQIWVDGVEGGLSSPGATPVAPSGDSYIMGPVPSGFGWAGDVAEILVWDNDIGDTAREATEDYLGAKYGITITH